MKGVTQRELEIVRIVCQKKLWYLCTEMLGYKDWSKKLHDAIAAHLDKPSKFKLFLVPRDHLKSSIITKGGSIQRLLRNPDIRILIANNTWDNSRKFLDSIRAYLAPGSQLSLFFGNFQTDRWNRDEIIVAQRKVIHDAPTIATTGLEKEQTSQHYDLIVADDLVGRENSLTKEQRQKVKDYINSLMALLEPNGEIWIVGTRWSQDDAYGDLIAEGIWDVFHRQCWEDEERTTPIFPEKFSKEKLDFLRKKLGPTLFSCWYLNDPIAPEAVDFKRDWFRYWHPTVKNQDGTETKIAHPHRLVLAVDPASSLGVDADFSGFTLQGMTMARKVRLVDCLKKRLVPMGVVDTIFDLVKKWKDRGHFIEVLIEAFGYQKTLKTEVQRRQRMTGLMFPVHEFKKMRGPNGEKHDVKYARIRGLQPWLEQGLYEIGENMPDFEDELLVFPNGRHDDLIDSAAMGLEHLAPSGATYQEQPKSDFKEVNGTYQPTLQWWLKKMPTASETIYDRFFADIKKPA